MLYTLETRFPTADNPKAEPIETTCTLEEAFLKAHAMIGYLTDAGWEIDKPMVEAPTVEAWTVAKLMPDGYMIAGLNIREA